jgi:hypothetical protein
VRHGKRKATDVFRAEVVFEQVPYRLALHAQSLFTAAACLGRRDEPVLPDGGAADLVSTTLNDEQIFSSMTNPIGDFVAATKRGKLQHLRELASVHPEEG